MAARIVRCGEQGIVMRLVRFDDQRWTGECEGLMSNACKRWQRSDEGKCIDELAKFPFATSPQFAGDAKCFW